MTPWTTPPPGWNKPDPLTIVVGPHGSSYPCPDLKALDRHLTLLCERLREATPERPSMVEPLREDIDCLLDRRRWLELATAPEPARREPVRRSA